MFYSTKGFENMELSTQILIKEAIKMGIEVEVLDRNENFIKLKRGNKEEYVKQATKTRLDTYMSYLIMENKLVTKKVLAKNKINVPDGNEYSVLEAAKGDFDLYYGKNIVIKPNQTNFGIGISILNELDNREVFFESLKLAFEYDRTILVENLVEGREYRFLVIGDEVTAVMYRVPANVIGDGKKTIIDLVEDKNRNPLRQKGYISPLEKINLGRVEEFYLKRSGKDFLYVPKNKEVVYLRENSNISTGGDSIDITDDVRKEYKMLAVNASKSVGAKICGADIIIKDIYIKPLGDNYSIIELNYNPAIHIHTYPYKGIGRNPAEKVLNLLGFFNT